MTPTRVAAPIVDALSATSILEASVCQHFGDQLDAQLAPPSGSPDARCIAVLEAGCGQNWPLKLPGLRINLTGVDLDAEALRIRMEREGDLHEAIVGDIQDAALFDDDRRFDLVYCAYVLEHVNQPETAVQNLFRWTRPGGLTVLLIPDPGSARGWVASHTPHWVHVAAYRWLLGRPSAGRPGHPPYRVHYSKYLETEKLTEVASSSSATLVVAQRLMGLNVGAVRSAAIRAVCLLIHWLSGGRLSADHDNVLLIFARVARRGVNPVAQFR